MCIFSTRPYGSAKEEEYQASLARRLGYLEKDKLERQAAEVARVLNALINALRNGGNGRPKA
jgi:four helix bundle protein